MNAPVRIDFEDAAHLPTRRSEDWKWTDLRRYVRETPPQSPPIEVEPGGPFAEVAARTEFA